jgi:hypothetical protein
VMGTVVGGAVGAFAGGFGAAPGAALGGQLGFDIGMAALAWMGLAFIVASLGQGLPKLNQQAVLGIKRAVHAMNLPPPARPAEMLEASRHFAQAQALLFKLILMGLVAWLLKKGAVSSAQQVGNSARAISGASKAGTSVEAAEAGVAELVAQLRKSRLGNGFADWVEGNWRQLIENPKLRPQTAVKAVTKGEAEVVTPSQLAKMGRNNSMKEPTQAAETSHTPKTTQSKKTTKNLKDIYPEEIKKVSTFKTIGMSTSEAEAYLSTEEGMIYIEELMHADPSASVRVIQDRAIGQLTSGIAPPKIVSTTEPLFKIVPEGEKVSDYSPFFTTESDLKAAQSSGKTLADYYGLPIKSEADVYDVYKIMPNSSSTIFQSTVAPTSELGGIVERAGGATQSVVPNRSNWSNPTLVGKLPN